MEKFFIIGKVMGSGAFANLGRPGSKHGPFSSYEEAEKALQDKREAFKTGLRHYSGYITKEK